MPPRGRAGLLPAYGACFLPCWLPLALRLFACPRPLHTAAACRIYPPSSPRVPNYCCATYHTTRTTGSASSLNTVGSGCTTLCLICFAPSPVTYAVATRRYLPHAATPLPSGLLNHLWTLTTALPRCRGLFPTHTVLPLLYTSYRTLRFPSDCLRFAPPV